MSAPTFIYENIPQAVMAAVRMRMELEMFVKPVPVIEEVAGASICHGWKLEYDPEGAKNFAILNNIILVVCSVCKRALGEKDTQGSRPGVSHGLCTRCADAMRRDVKFLH